MSAALMPLMILNTANITYILILRRIFLHIFVVFTSLSVNSVQNESFIYLIIVYIKIVSMFVQH